MQLAMIQDKVIPFEEIDNVYLDRGTFFGDGVYEVVRSYNGRIFHLNEHLNRFQRSLNEVMIDGVDIKEIRNKVESLFEQAGIANAKIYFHITRGSEVRNHICNPNTKPNFFMTISELGDGTKEKETGITVCTHPDLRWKRCDIKSLNLLPNVLAKMDAEKKGCSEAILVNDNGEITEGSSSAFFAIINNKLVTRPTGKEILPSITRQVVIELAGKVGLDIDERVLTPKEASQGQELFIAVTTKDIVPVVKFDDCVIGDGTPGEYTKKLIEEFKNSVEHVA